MSNREWLKQLAASETKTWMTAVAPLGLAGVHRLETRHTIYVFKDGVCADMARRDGEEQSNSDLTMIGMRVVGWLLDIEGQRRLLERWLPGARAVMWRAPTNANGKSSRIAMTSPSFGFVACSQPDEDEDDDADLDTTAEWVPVTPPVASGSFTRLFPQEG
jgi:hypothetical protein